MTKLIQLSVCIMVFSISASLLSQPQYYNYNTQGTNNAFPLSSLPATGKTTQTLYLAGAFSQPSPAPSGNITKIYLMVSTSGNATYTSLTIKMGQTTDTDLPTGAWYTGTMTTVFDEANYNLVGTAGQFMPITLETPFNYNPAQSIVVEITQCGYSGTGIGLGYTALSGNKRSAGPLSGTPCPHPWGNQQTYSTHAGIDVAPASQGPNYLHYKFENNPAPLSVLNCGNPGAGTPVAVMTGLTLTPGGQFDSCITGAGSTGAGVVTGWNNNLATSSWTISMWVDLPTTTFGYLFGDGAGSFRCFNNGAAGTNGITLRGTGLTNVDVTGFGSGPVVVHFVYDSALANIKVYKNGVLSNTVSQTPLNLAAGTGFKAGGYTTVAGFTGKMDEFRLYRRALDAAEVAATWNQDIACGTLVPVVINNNEVPKTYSLFQNYPNPFNPVTSIKFAVPNTGFVNLKVYDALGREVEVLVSERVNAGTYEIKFDASKYSSGIYFYSLETADYRETKKMMLIK